MLVWLEQYRMQREEARLRKDFEDFYARGSEDWKSTMLKEEAWDMFKRLERLGEDKVRALLNIGFEF